METKANGATSSQAAMSDRTGRDSLVRNYPTQKSRDKNPSRSK
jgi:hypothetical protein